MKKYFIFLSVIILVSFESFGQVGTDKPKYQILTNRAGSFLGSFEIELFPAVAPLHVHNFDSLVNNQFFDSTAFHRVVPGFVIQGGDPNSISGPIATWGQGQPWQVTVPAEFSVVRHLRGILGAARDNNPNSASSQFYICVANATSLDGNYTVYGKVTSGMNIVDTIVSAPRDGNDNPLQKIEMFVSYVGVNDSIPYIPILIAPANGASGILNTQNFVWTPVSSAVMYTLEFSTDPGFSTIDISVNAGNNSIIVPALPGSMNFFWRVKSNNGGHESVYSNVFNFNSATAAPNLIFPPDSSTGISINPVFTWDAAPNADSYTLQVSIAPTFTVPNMIYNTAGLTSTSQQVNGLNPNSLYYWRVRSASGTTQGFYSSKFSFSTGSSTGIESHSSPLYFISLYPNPVVDEFSFSVHVNSGQNASILITDISGRIVYREEAPMVNSKLEHNISTQNIEAGIYFLSVNVDGNKVNRKITVL